MKHAPPMVDDCGEDDFAYFRRRPDVSSRLRLPFPDEFPADVIELARGRSMARGAMVVIVVIDRDSAGNPTTRGRGISFSDIEEGRA
jgi:hypothetical protein